MLPGNEAVVSNARGSPPTIEKVPDPWLDRLGPFAGLYRALYCPNLARACPIGTIKQGSAFHPLAFQALFTVIPAFRASMTCR